MYFTGFAVIFEYSKSMPFQLHPPNFIFGGVLASGEISHLEPDENDQSRPNKNSQ
jgi:hypothetical protein